MLLRSRPRGFAALAIACGLAAPTVSAFPIPPEPPGAEQADTSDDDEEEVQENPWVVGPEAERPAEDQHPGMPPREPDASVEPLQIAPEQFDPPIPLVDHGLRQQRQDLRMTTSLSREELFAWGDLNLADGLTLMPGLWWPADQAGGQRPHARGLDSEYVGVRVDGVPVLPHEAFPGFPVLGLIPLDEVQAVHFRHGPRFGGGLEGAAGGVLDIETLPPAKDLGESAMVSGRVRGGYGGPDLEKAIFLRGEAGWRRARISVSGGGRHRDQLRQGRGLGLVENSFGLDGYLVVRGDVIPMRGLRVWAVWQGARQARTPLTSRCTDDDSGRYADCIFTQDRSRDTVAAGIDTTHRLWLVEVSSKTRVHGQRFGEHWFREGQLATALEQTFTTLWRGGAISEVTVRGPALTLLDRFSPEVTVGGELLRDRVTSSYEARSRFSNDAVVDYLPDPQQMPIASGGQRNLVRGFGQAGLYGRVLSAHLRAEGVWHHNVLIRPDLDRMEGRIAGRQTLTSSAEVTVRLQPLPWLGGFASVLRTERPDALYDIGYGPQQFEALPALPALPNHTRFVENALEVGGDVKASWLEVAAVGFVADRSGPRTVGFDAAEAVNRPGVERLIRANRRQAGGIEARARWKTPLDGLSAEGSFAAVAVDEGVFFRGADPFAPVPVAGVPRPTGAAALHWAPTDWPIQVWGRLRYALPQARLAAEEAVDTSLCPQGVIDPQLEPCQGLFGYALYDLGLRLEPSKVLRLEAMASNLLDNPWKLRLGERPGGGVAARVTATLQF